MVRVRFSVTLVAIVGVIAATIAGSTTWLLLTDPIGASDAAGRLAAGDIGPFLQAIAAVASAALQGLVSYL